MLKKQGWRAISRLIAFGVAMVLSLVLAVPALANGTTADVTVKATGAYVSYSANQTDYDFSIVAAGSTTNTTGDWVLFTNSSSVSTNISVKMLASTWTSTGTGWTHSDTAADVNTVAMKASSDNGSTWSTSVFIKFNSPFLEIGSSITAGSDYTSGLSLLAPTSFADGASNNNTIRFTFYQE